MKSRYLLAACVAGLLTLPVWAQDAYPNKPIKIIVPYPPGGSADILARDIGQRLSAAWSQPVVIENRGGAAGMTGTQAAARSPADGYTLMLTASGPQAIAPSLYPKPGYDPIKDFAPVVLTSRYPLLMVAPANAPYSDTKQFIEWATRNKGKVNYCSIGPGSPSNLAGELFKSMAGIEMTHIPYKGSAQALTDLIGGVCNLMFDSVATSGPQVKGGKIKALAISTPERAASWPSVPTVSESGVPGFSAITWAALFAPASTPEPIVQKLNAEVGRILASPEVRGRLDAQGGLVGGGTPAELRSFNEAEIRKWAKIIKDNGITAE
ncbi:tripartite tricarboxylate transporter substrate binding protein [Acidovorax sp. JG5]|uniref:Bug family tripartite tricarboxylate transporter substrate binding protein n=1 Tax=Acidovorax sp. JG5 TaxID=2822718 RepID=UPI001B32E39D|nr:tripartite tricarboxylate transporter substrate binding protein [Acidovorax sp. JG5]MBP3979543.1 tripartite tricarboxylate transporter substrate binding protein [Acidovorax sp. JG5]